MIFERRTVPLPAGGVVLIATCWLLGREAFLFVRVEGCLEQGGIWVYEAESCFEQLQNADNELPAPPAPKGCELSTRDRGNAVTCASTLLFVLR